MHPRRSQALLLLLVICAPREGTAQQTDAAQTRAAGKVMAEYGKPDRPGCAVGAYQDGRTVWEGAVGLANLEHAVPIDPTRTVFGVGSIAKQFTAASTLLLAKDGKLRLDDDIRKYLPEMPDYGRVITIDHLMNHTSGLRDYLGLRWMKGTTWWAYTTEEESLTDIARQTTLNFPPGSKYSYTNTGFFLLSQIIHRVSGKTLAAFAHERIFRPLGMQHTRFEDSLGLVTPHLASGYAKRDGSYETRSDRAMPYGAGGLRTTVADLARWQRNFDDPKVGGAALIKQLEARGALNDGTAIDYGRGLAVLEVGGGGFHGLRTVAHGGSEWEGHHAEVMRLADHKFSVVVLCNSSDARPRLLRNEITRIFMAGKLPDMPSVAAVAPDTGDAPAATSSSKELAADLVGTYWNREEIALHTIEFSRGKLWYARSSESRSELVPLANGQWLMRGVAKRTVVESVTSASGARTVRVAGGGDAVLERVEPFSTDALEEYAGVYTSSELGNARFVFVVKDRQLVLQPPHEGISSPRPVFKDALLSSGYEVLFLFQRDAAGRVTSVIVDVDRVRNVVFTKVPG